MGHRHFSALSALAFLAALAMAREPDASAGGAQPPQTPNTCGIGGKDAAPAGTQCDDQNKCTTGDACDGDGRCVGKPVLCPSGPCTTAACDASTGACVSTNKADGTRCGPGTCKNGVCAFRAVPPR